ncbi:O-methyltransferase [Galdieria sulphuraria]|uniref:O-methyltransferase n=1 Tax=Galdieria sulphuraria TaxID=130081 RepID=M2XXP2_GALSU|nr:O-methyltransferase [Galdieria sulphuraria]EME28209.1 O-methyltransferase [Galdieria sulphuraria]|eukprot:XP_005704729.1 O-methyltransferase [Galdieria sulphuraria]
MASLSNFDTNAVLNTFDFSKFQSICDVGAGPGTLLKAILKKHPQIRGVIADLPQVIEQAEPCDFFQGVPRNHDLYIMKHVLHDWDDNKGIQILKTVKECSPSHAKLMLLEYVVPGSNITSSGKLFDLHMGIVNNGKERTEEEWKNMLVAGGWNYLGYENTKGIISVILASKD